MTTLLHRLDTTFRTPTGHLILVALATSALTLGTVLSAQSLSRHQRRTKLRDEVEDRLHRRRKKRGLLPGKEEEEEESDSEGDGSEGEEMIDFTRRPTTGSRRVSTTSKNTSSTARRRTIKPTSPIIISEALARNAVFFGEEGMKKIRKSFVVVVGVGGVGSATATMLVRSGIRKIRIIDFDQVSLSSLNRHATASLAQVGTPKVTSCAEAYKGIAPWVEVDARIALFNSETSEELLEGEPDYVIDCIDNIESKVELLVHCHKRGIPVFSSLGAGAKSDPSRIQVSDISTTFEDPLARSVRRRLRLEGITSGIPVVYSTEKPRPDIGLLPLAEEEYQKGKVEELSAMNNFRVRILPVLGPLPAMFGNAAAAYVLQAIAGFPQETLPVKNRYKMASTIHRQLSAVELRLTGDNKLPISEEDVLYFFEEIHRARSCAPPHEVPSRPCLLRWKKEKGLAWDNVVVFGREEGAKHEQLCLVGDEDPEKVWGPEITELVERRFAEERRIRHYRL